MSKLFDESFYTKDYDKEMLDYVKGNYTFDLESNEGIEVTCLYYNSVDKDFNKISITPKESKCLTKQQFKEKIGMVDNNTPAEPITEPVAEPDDELEILSYQDIIDKCKTTNTNLVITGEGVYILDCINSVEYKVESPDDYEDIINAIELLQRKEVGVD